MVEQPAFARGEAPLLNFATEPLVVFNRSGEQVQRQLLRVAAGTFRKASQLGREFGRNMQFH